MSTETPERRTVADKVAEVADLIRDGATKTEAVSKVFGNGRTYWNAIKGRPDLEHPVLQAMSDQCDRLADEALKIADDTTLDPQAARNRVSIRQWIASKRAPAKYGDRLEVAGLATISVQSALEAAIALGNRRVSEIHPVIDAELIEAQPELTTQAPAEEPDIFS